MRRRESEEKAASPGLALFSHHEASFCPVVRGSPLSTSSLEAGPSAASGAVDALSSLALALKSLPMSPDVRAGLAGGGVAVGVSS